MIPAIVGFMPWLNRRLNILTKSGTAAKVVPNPATNPRISDRETWGPAGSPYLLSPTPHSHTA